MSQPLPAFVPPPSFQVALSLFCHLSLPPDPPLPLSHLSSNVTPRHPLSFPPPPPHHLLW